MQRLHRVCGGTSEPVNAPHPLISERGCRSARCGETEAALQGNADAPRVLYASLGIVSLMDILLVMYLLYLPFLVRILYAGSALHMHFM